MATTRSKKSSTRKSPTPAKKKQAAPARTAVQHAIARETAGFANKLAHKIEVRDRKVARARAAVLKGLAEICDAMTVDAERRDAATATIERQLDKLVKPRARTLTPAQVAAL